MNEDKEIKVDSNQSKADLSIISNTDKIIDNLNELISSANPLSKSKEVESLKAEFYSIINSTDKNTDEIEKKFKSIYSKYKKDKNIALKNIEKNEELNLKIKKEIISEIKGLTSEIEIKKETFNKFKELQERWKATGFVNIKYKNEIWQTYNHYVEVFYDYLKLNKDLRDMDFKKNLESKKDLCKKAEKLISLKSLNKMHDELQDLHEKWKNIGPIKKEDRKILWERFQLASKKINKKRNDFYNELKIKDQEKTKYKKEICKEIKKLSKTKFQTYKVCEDNSKKVEALCEKWKKIGRINKKDNKECWKEYRDALNGFYKLKNDFYKKKKEENKKTILLKTKICEKAEKLQNDTNWNETSKKLINLQKEWKKTGYVKGKLNDTFWNKFKKSCDTFFNSKKKYEKELDLEKTKKIKSKNDIILSISNYKLGKDIKKDIQFIEDKISEWIKIGKTENTSQLNNNLTKTYNKLLASLKIDKQELTKIKSKFSIKLIKNNPKELNYYKSSLLEKIKEKQKEIDLFETNKSFLVSAKSNNSLRDQINKKIEKLIIETDQLKKELKLIKSS